MPVCAACGQENPAGFRFCGACGAELAAAAPAREQRKTVTVLFCDVTGSTALGEELDPEALRRTMARYFEEIRRIVEHHGGTVEKFVGDAAMAVFGIPVSHEDDALRAVRAAAEIRERVGALGDELGIALSFRTGVNTGEAVAGAGETIVTGDAVNTAARLEQAARPGEVLLGAATLGLVRDAVEAEPVEPLELKGKREPVAAYRLVSVDPSAEGFARHLDAPLVGRALERARLNGEFELVVAERACHLFTLLGPAGVGKSRLVAEFLADVGDGADVLRARCLHYGEDITYWPLVEIVLAAGVAPEEVIGTSPAETQLTFRKLLEQRAAERPQVVVVEDIQWAEPVFLDLIEHVADWSRDAPILLLCVARPELLEARPGWGGGKLNAATILLEPLSADDCDRLMDELAVDAVLEPDVRRRILAAAAGIPLFVEEMLATVAEGDGGADVVVPPTIQALLQARLDGLGPEERDVIGRGSVEGEVFHRGVVQELAEASGREGVPAHLLTLVRKDMIRPDHPKFADDDAFRFRHLLIRDAAYDTLPKETRAELHERFADWLERHPELVELDEITGYHLAQAHANRSSLDPSDPRLDGLARRAAAHLERAARGALGRGDVGAAGGLLERAAALLPEGDAERLELLIELQWPLLQAGRLDDARSIVAELAASGETRFCAWSDLVSLTLDANTGRFWGGDARARLDKVRRALENLADDRGLAQVEWAQFGISWAALRAEEGRTALARGVEHATRAGAMHLAQYFGSWQGAALQFGPTPVEQVLTETEQAIAAARGPLELAGAQRRLGRVFASVGDFDEARALYEAGAAAARDAGLLIAAAGAGMGKAFIERRAGDDDAAEAAIRDSIAELEALGDRNFYPTLCADLARLLIQRGEDEEAASWCARARAMAAPSDLATIAPVEVIDGLLHARRGELEEGERLGRRSLELLAESDFYELAGECRLVFARTLDLCGKRDEARAVAAEALAIYEAKGDLPAAVWARELLESLGP